MKNWHKIFIDYPILLSSPEEMKQLGVRIGKLLEPGEVLGIVGDLGAGKTHLSQGIIEGVGSKDSASSPTFSLVHEHIDGRTPVYHFDFYRLKNEEELISIDWEGYLDRGGIILVEWADMFPHALPADSSWLLLTHHGERERQIELKIL